MPKRRNASALLRAGISYKQSGVKLENRSCHMASKATSAKDTAAEAEARAQMGFRLSGRVQKPIERCPTSTNIPSLDVPILQEDEDGQKKEFIVVVEGARAIEQFKKTAPKGRRVKLLGDFEGNNYKGEANVTKVETVRQDAQIKDENELFYVGTRAEFKGSGESGKYFALTLDVDGKKIGINVFDTKRRTVVADALETEDGQELEVTGELQLVPIKNGRDKGKKLMRVNATSIKVRA